MKSESLAYDQYSGQFTQEYDPENDMRSMRLFRECFLDRLSDYLEAGDLDDFLREFAHGINATIAKHNFGAMAARLAQEADKDAKQIWESI